jgi:hypothetical protein
MNIILRGLQNFFQFEKELFLRKRLVPREVVEIMVLLSATCVGNDAKSCPLFHGSLAPMIFSRINFDGVEDVATRGARYRLQRLLLKSNNITWINHISFFRVDDISGPDKIVNVLSQKRYIAPSIKSVEIPGRCLQTDQLKSFLISCCPRIEEIRLEHCNLLIPEVWPIDDVDFEFLSQFTFLTTLILRPHAFCFDCDFTHVGIQHLTKLRLKRLHLSGIKLKKDAVDEILKTICCITSLEDLNLPVRSVTDCNVHYLKNLPRLQKLRLKDASISDEGLEQIASIQTLKSLELKDCRSFTNDGLRHFINLTYLEYLYLDFSQYVTSACVEHLLDCPSLRCVNAELSSYISSADLQSFHKKLRERQLENAKQFSISSARRERE